MKKIIPLFALLASTAVSAPFQADIVVSGGSFSAPAAAISAARTWPSAQILLIEPTDWLGGQGTSQGVAAIDNAWYAPANTLMNNNRSLYYPADYLDFLDELSPVPLGAPGTGLAPNGTSWVSREAYDPRTAAFVLDEMVAAYPNITVLKLTVLKDLNTVPVNDSEGVGVKITDLTLIERTPANGYVPFTDFTSVEFPDWYSTANSARFTKEVHTVQPVDVGRGLVVIDASETADAIVLSGARYTVGREISTEKVAANGTLPAMDEDGGNAVVYPFMMTGNAVFDSEASLKTPFPGLDSYIASQPYSTGSFTWQRVWTYRRLLTTASPFQFDTVTVGDASMQNWNPGNDYFTGFLYTSSASAALEAATDWNGGINLSTLSGAERHAMGWYFYMKNTKPGSISFDTRLAKGTDALNMMGTAHGLAKFPYIRGGRRAVGIRNFRITQRDWDNTLASNYTGGTSYRYFDSVGIGNYAADVRAVSGSSGISPEFERPAPFYIPYRALASQNVRNLLVAGKTMAQTYVTNSAYRLHPIEWVSGTAAGNAASRMAEEGLANFELLRTDRLRAMQADIDGNSPISWAYADGSGTGDEIPEFDGDLIVNDRKNARQNVGFDLAVWHYDAVSAEFLYDATLLGTTSLRENGELILKNQIISTAGTYTITANLRNGLNQLIETVTTSLTVDSLIDPLSIVDNTDPGFSTTGSWSSGTAQSDKYGTNYRFATGITASIPTATATWQLYTPTVGTYSVFVWYPASSNRSSVSPFTVNHSGGSTVVPVNQKVTGGEWVPLGDFTFNGPGTGTIVLGNNVSVAGEFVLADAVRASLIVSGSDVETWSLHDY